MKISSGKNTIDTEKDNVIFIFEDDNELNSFIQKLATIEVKTSGVRIIPLIHNEDKLNPLQKDVFDIINGLDGACSNNEKINEKISDESIDRLNDVLEKYSKK